MKFAKLRSGLELNLRDVNDLGNLQRVLESSSEDEIFDILMIFQYQAIRIRRQSNFNHETYDWWFQRLSKSLQEIEKDRLLQLKTTLRLQSVEEQVKFGRKMIINLLWKD